MTDIAEWLDSLGLGRYAEAFEENAIEWVTLPELDHELLKEIGVKPVGHRVAILKAIRSLGERGDESPPAVAESAPVPQVVPGGEAERRQLTVMFCDLVGSTALSTRLDPEDLRELITSFQDKCREAIGQYGGFIARYMGDGMLVYFGYPRAHEDDAERAVRAGLAVVESMADLDAGIGATHDAVLSVRVGVATGSVVVGDIVGEGAAEEAAVVGETPNLAARLQAQAEPGQVVVAPTTRDLLGALFEYDDLGPRSLKGIAEPVRAWRVVGEGDAESRYAAKQPSGGSPLVGRREELGLLTRSWETSKEGHGQVVLIQGEAGIGKSRLLEALREHVAGEEYHWIAHRCSPYHANSALYPVIEHLKRMMGWKPEDDPARRLAKLEAAVGTQSLPLAEAVPLFADLMSLPLPEGRYAPLELGTEQQREQTLDALAAWVLESAERTPVLCVWEDLHWADPTTLELLGLFIDQSPTVPILLVLTFRQEFSPPWSMRSHMTPITLNRLERPEAEALVAHRAGGKRMPETVVAHILEKADGVPLYLEELTKTILDSDSMTEEADAYVLKGSLEELEIPSTLQDSLMARLDRAPTMREVAQVGAVLGREFAYELLRAMVGLDEPQLASGLGQLVDDELLYQRGRPPRSRYIFKHALIQDAAYQSLLKRTRQQYHLRVGKLLEERFPETVAAHPELLAHHYTEGGAAEEAIAAWHAAGELARSRGANREAVTHLGNGLALARDLPDAPSRARHELRLQVSLGGVLLQMKGHSAAETAAAFARARELCEQVGDAPEVVPALFGLWRAYVVQMEEIETPRKIAAQLLRLARDAKDPVRWVIANYTAGFTGFTSARFPAAEKHFRESLQHYAIEDRRKAEVYRFGQDPGVACRCYLAMTDLVRGFPDRGRRHARDSIDLAARIDDAFTIAYALAFTAWIDQLFGDLEGMFDKASRAIALSEEKGFPYWLSIGRVMKAWGDAVTHPEPETVAALGDRVAQHHGLGTNLFMPSFNALQAEAALMAGEVDVCGMALDEAEAFQRRTGELSWAAEIERLRGELVSAVTRDDAAAERHFREALALARRHDAKGFELRAAMGLARLQQRRHGGDDGRAVLAAVVDAFSEGFDSKDLRIARDLLDAPRVS